LSGKVELPFARYTPQAWNNASIRRGVIADPSLARMVGSAPKEYANHFRRVQNPNNSIIGVYN